MNLKFVTGEPAILCGKTLVISDLHIGIEYRYRKEGMNIPSQSGKLLERIEKLLKKTRAKKLIIIGDVKHKVPGTSFQEEKEIPLFFNRLLEKAEVEITPGNHDDRIKKLLPGKVTLHPSKGFMLGDTWLCHGHAWPVKEFLDSKRIVMGHNHASIELSDKLGYTWRDPVWVRAELDRKKLSERYKRIGKTTPELILIPPFNGFAGLVPLNKTARGIRKYFREGPNPMFRISKKRKARVYMLDGTFLGELGKL
jgi:putative SbcD/Mre11-related phosphoesterase